MSLRDLFVQVCVWHKDGVPVGKCSNQGIPHVHGASLTPGPKESETRELHSCQAQSENTRRATVFKAHVKCIVTYIVNMSCGINL